MTGEAAWDERKPQPPAASQDLRAVRNPDSKVSGAHRGCQAPRVGRPRAHLRLLPLHSYRHAEQTGRVGVRGSRGLWQTEGPLCTQSEVRPEKAVWKAPGADTQLAADSLSEAGGSRTPLAWRHWPQPLPGAEPAMVTPGWVGALLEPSLQPPNSKDTALPSSGWQEPRTNPPAPRVCRQPRGKSALLSRRPRATAPGAASQPSELGPSPAHQHHLSSQSRQTPHTGAPPEHSIRLLLGPEGGSCTRPLRQDWGLTDLMLRNKRRGLGKMKLTVT